MKQQYKRGDGIKIQQWCSMGTIEDIIVRDGKTIYLVRTSITNKPKEYYEDEIEYIKGK